MNKNKETVCKYCYKKDKGEICKNCFDFSMIYYDIMEGKNMGLFDKNEMIIIRKIGEIRNFDNNPNPNIDKYIIGRDKILNIFIDRAIKKQKQEEELFNKFIKEK